MNLEAILRPEFESAVRHRGQQYFRQGLVRIVHGSDKELSAIVHGSQAYRVQIRDDDGELILSCTCPFAGSDGACKHLWATILCADSKGHLRAAAASAAYVAYEDPVEDEDEVRFDLVPPNATPLARVLPAPAQPIWRKQLDAFSRTAIPPQVGASAVWPPRRQLLYIVDPVSSHGAGVMLQLLTRERKAKGDGWNQARELRWRTAEIGTIPEAVDRELLVLLCGPQSGYYSLGSDLIPARVRLPAPLAAMLIPRMAQTGRLCISRAADDFVPLEWAGDEPWQFEVAIAKSASGAWALNGIFARNGDSIPLNSPQAFVAGGFLFAAGRVAPLAADSGLEWMSFLGRERVTAPDAEKNDLLAAILQSPSVPRLVLPDELQFEEVRPTPRPCLSIRSGTSYTGQPRFEARLGFDYDGTHVSAGERRAAFYDGAKRRLIRRVFEAEAAAIHVLTEAGAKQLGSRYDEPRAEWEIGTKKLPRIVSALLEQHWHIEADGKAFRRSRSSRLDITSTVDWFELRADIDFDGASAALPELLAAMRKGDTMVRLDDGTYGMIPEEWLAKIGAFAALGTPDGDHVRFRRSQAGLLDALLAAQPETTFDEGFRRARQALRDFERIEPAVQPDGFQGQLRDYQREGLAWMNFLRTFGFGGCLADDMGVGKTAQVLALLESRRAARNPPSLVVVPRSLVFNWKQEAARFTPDLRVLDHTGAERGIDTFTACDVVLTTYGTLRRDVPLLREHEFDYIILDESQAIKNASTESAKAVRLLNGRHRLALSGTPIENHLGELWSLFEFLNPGMLGAASAFQLAGAGPRNPDEESRKLLAHAVRPFILRRTKQQVAKELPAKNEQTILCELEPPQRKVYNELRSYYRDTLLGRIDKDGMNKSRMHVLEALLRLRQAACHPGLIDAKRTGEGSAKLDLLLARVAEVREERHKALVFSQFTSLLAIVRQRLDEAGIAYEYLDGKTRDRQACVERFQRDAGCGLFLISLKAGGLGLNLTAAEYVFLLDPWWNPAVEAQAIDRAHRIGQERQVFAYRLIARETVEEKVLELQNTKRDLASAIIAADNNLIGNLRREDLELLLS